MRVLTLTSCTGEKAVRVDRALTLGDFQKGPAHVAERERELAGAAMPAGEIYTGEQHLRLMRGVQQFREAIAGNGIRLDMHILSAGYGIIPEGRRIVPYEVTFATMKV